MGKPVNLAGVRKARDAAKSITPEGAPPGEGDASDVEGGLPEACPVRALGKDGKVRYYLDADRQLIALADRDHSRLGIQGLFGQRSYLLFEYWPRRDKHGNTTGWAPDGAALALMAACSRAGLWDPRERQRGRGAWLGEDGALVLHTGRQVMTFPATRTPYLDQHSVPAGLVGRYVYSAADGVGTPSSDPAPAGPDGPAETLLKLLSSWQWRRGEIDAVLMLGWIGAAMIGGALKWRPAAWLTGGKGTGKSTLHDVLKLVFDGALVQTADTTAAGLYQTLRHQTLPISVDELEAEADNRRANAVIRLARLAASGALMLRGGAEHSSTEFVVRSSFLFSSILIPPLTPQDRSRISVLDLNELAKDAPVPVLDPKTLAALGSQLRRRLIDGWTRLEAVLAHYREALQEAGHSARAADQLGTLLACADVVLFDDHEPGSAEDWVKGLTSSELAEADDNQRDEERCLAHLLSSPVDVFRGGSRRTIGEWIRIACGFEGLDDEVDAKRVLGTYGLKLLDPTPALDDRAAQPRMLAVANQHKGLAALYADSHWQGTSGTMGVWVQALRRLPGADRARAALYFAGATCKAVTIPLTVVVPLDSVAESHHGWMLKRG